MKKYIVYITYYKGKLLPPFYIGSSYEDKINKGYNGTILSKKYKEIYKKEQKENKHLFRTKILSYHETREEALKEELRLQKKHNVVTNVRYFNESYAQVKGYFGRDVSGELHPMYGKTHGEESKQKMSTSAKARGINRIGSHSEETKIKISKNRKGKGPEHLSEKHKEAISKGLKGKEKSNEHCNNISKALKESEKHKESIKKVSRRKKLDGSYKEAGEKIRKKYNEKIIIDGKETTLAKEKGKKIKEKYEKESQKYNIIINDSIYKVNITMRDIRKISQALPKTNFDKRLGGNSISIRALERNNNKHLIGAYIVKA